MSARSILRDSLRDSLPAWQIVSDPRALDTIRKPGGIVLGTNRRQRVATLGLGWFTEEMILWILTATTKPDDIEDDLDELLLAVLEVLEPMEAFHWDTAERGVLADTWDGYKLTVTGAVQLVGDTEDDDNEE